MKTMSQNTFPKQVEENLEGTGLQGSSGRKKHQNRIGTRADACPVGSHLLQMATTVQSSGMSELHLMVAYCCMWTVVNVGWRRVMPVASYTGEWILIWRRCVSRPFWWLESTAIWIMNARTALAVVGSLSDPEGSCKWMIIQPEGSFSSTCWSSVRSLKWLPTRTDSLRNTYSSSLCNLTHNLDWDITVKHLTVTSTFFYY